MSLGPDIASQSLRPGWDFDILFLVGRWAWPVHGAVTVLTFILLSELHPRAEMDLWLVAMVAISAFQSVLALVYARRLPPPGPDRIYGVLHLILTGLAALGWGAGALVLNSGPQTALVYYSMILGATALAAVGTQLTRLANCMTSIWLSLPLLALAHAQQGTAAGLSMAAMVLLFALSLSIAAWLMERFLQQRAILIEQLGEQNEQLRSLAGELSAAQAGRLRFLAQASHDIRQPIHAISLFVECLKPVRMPAEDHGILLQIDRSLKSLALLCRSLLDLSALDVGRIRVAPADLPLQDIIDDVLRQAADQAREWDVRLRCRPSRAWVHADPALLHNMLQNLVSNAVKYAPGGSVLVGVRRSDGGMAVDVIDTGKGIRAEDQDRIFGEFVRLNGRRAMPAEGLGLGLTIVQRLATMVGLTLTLQSWPGRGTRFRIGGLTVAPARPLVRTADRYARQLEGMRVLIIDDDPTVLLGTSQLLARWGCIALALDSVPEVESRAPGRDFDLVLCDENSQSRSGLAYIAGLKAHWQCEFPAIVVTGQDVEELRAGPSSQGVHVLSKPVNPARLRSLLQALHAGSPPSVARVR